MSLSTKTSIHLRYFHLPILSLFLSLRFSCGSDVFCGNLTVYRQKWPSANAVVFVSRTTNDLKQCLHICCSLSECEGVTFVGVIEKKIAQENCFLIRCYGKCQFDSNSSELSEGVSVKITRATQNSTLDDLSMLPGDNMLNSSKISLIWSIGLIIIVSILCVCLSIILISAFICWQRKKKNKRKAHISTIRTLHAFNPT